MLLVFLFRKGSEVWLCVAVEWKPLLVHTHRKVVHPHIWGTDELNQKHLDGVIAPKGISN